MKTTIASSRKNGAHRPSLVLSFLPFLVLVVLGFTAPANTCRAAKWVWQNPVPTANPLRGVFFTNQNYGWAVGDFGEISKTTDGGATWSLQRIGTDPMSERGRQQPYFNSIYFIDNNTGWVVGTNPLHVDDVSIILKTTDGGNHWISQRIGSGNIVSVHFVDQFTGWAVDKSTSSTVLKTTDGGTNWVPQSNLPYVITAAFFRAPLIPSLDQTHGWAVGAGGVILKTTNGGASWELRPSGTTQYLTSIHFVDEFNGWVVGYDNTAAQAPSTVLKTVDGGETWASQASGTTLSLRSVKFIDTFRGWAVGGNGDEIAIILRTADGGQSWSGQTFKIGESNRLDSVSFVDQNTGWTVGLDGTILKTTNGGNNWTLLSPGTRAGLRGIHMLSDTKGWITGGFGLEGALLKTTNGVNWTPKILGGPALSAVRFATPSIGWAAGNNGTILKTTDGGETWSSQDSMTSETLQALQFTDSSEGWVAGDHGVIRHTTDGGTHWTPQTTGGTWLLSSLYFFDRHIGWAAGLGGGVGGVILKTTDGGENWSTRLTVSESLRWVQFSDANNGWAVGGEGNGIIERTTDGGDTWALQLFSPSIFRSVQPISANVAWVVGQDWRNARATILKTINGGQSWTPQQIVFGGLYLGAYFTNESTGWIVGANGAILHTGCIACLAAEGVSEPLELMPEALSVPDPLFVPLVDP